MPRFLHLARNASVASSTVTAGEMAGGGGAVGGFAPLHAPAASHCAATARASSHLKCPVRLAVEFTAQRSRGMDDAGAALRASAAFPQTLR
jgi:hypothetical protein